MRCGGGRQTGTAAWGAPFGGFFGSSRSRGILAGEWGGRSAHAWGPAPHPRRESQTRLSGLPASRCHCHHFFVELPAGDPAQPDQDRKSTRLNSSHLVISYAVFCLKKKKRSNHIESLIYMITSDYRTSLCLRVRTRPHTMIV